MTRLAAKTLIALGLAAALALAGCGGGDDDSTSTTTTGAGGETAVQAEELRHKRDERLRREAEQGGSGGGKSVNEVPFREPTASAPTTIAPLPNEGGKAVAPGVPTAKGGDNSIQEFGVEAPSSDRVEASRVLQAYLNARLDGEWALACSYMSASIKRQLGQLGGQAGSGESPDCVQTMRAFTQGVPEEALRSAADIRVLSMRVEGEQAFLLYRDGEGLPSSVPMNEEDGAWKVAAIAGSALFLGV